MAQVNGQPSALHMLVVLAMCFLYSGILLQGSNNRSGVRTVLREERNVIEIDEVLLPWMVDHAVLTLLVNLRMLPISYRLLCCQAEKERLAFPLCVLPSCANVTSPFPACAVSKAVDGAWTPSNCAMKRSPERKKTKLHKR